MIPQHAPFSSEQAAGLNSLISGLSAEQATWLSGYLAGVAPQAGGAAAQGAPAKLAVLFGTESGNSEELADRTVKAAKKKGIKATLTNLADISPSDLTKFDNMALIVSTWGDGDPPEQIEGFHEAFLKETPDLKGKKFSICALGDTSYEQFCEIGKVYDARLEALGAERLTDREDCDVDYDEAYEAWTSRLFDSLGSAQQAGVALVADAVASAPAEVFDKKNPFPSEVLENQLLNEDGSAKETIHVELCLEGSGLNYEVGDALGVVPHNAADVVEDVLKAGGFSADEEVEHKVFGKATLQEAFTEKLDITSLARSTASKYLKLGAGKELEELLSDDKKEEFSDWIWGRQLVDLLTEFPIKGLSAQDFVSILRKMPPRLYSIASSLKAHPDEVHLTVAAVRYEGHGKDRKGVASTYLADDCGKGQKVSVFVHHNKNFRLPESDDTPLIMIGPGTGIAPFRAFVEERAERGAKGDSWLFFGDQKYNYDFLYQLEWQDYLKSGALSRLDVAFSRDQPEKYYVQHVMEENGGELFAWLEKGAHFYVCGDAQRMAKDVHQMLINIVSEHGKLSEEDAVAYVDDLKKAKRYQRDVY